MCKLTLDTRQNLSSLVCNLIPWLQLLKIFKLPVSNSEYNRIRSYIK